MQVLIHTCQVSEAHKLNDGKKSRLEIKYNLIDLALSSLVHKRA